MRDKNNEFLPIACRVCSLKAGPNDTICGRFYIAYINTTKKVLGVQCATCGEKFVEMELSADQVKNIITTLLGDDKTIRRASKIINDIDDES